MDTTTEYYVARCIDNEHYEDVDGPFGVHKAMAMRDELNSDPDKVARVRYAVEARDRK